MSFRAGVLASTTDPSDISAVYQGLPIQNLCEACENIFASKAPVDRDETHTVEHHTPTGLRVAASKGCGICKLVISSKVLKNGKWPIEDERVMKVSISSEWGGRPTHLGFWDDPGSSRVKTRKAYLRLLGSQDASELKPRALSPSSLGTDSLESFETVTKWLATCNSSHADCTKPNTQPIVLPVRMLEIDLERHEPIERIRLRCDVRPTRYATLSHCWGPDIRNIPRLLQGNLSDRMQEIMLDTLPRTFTDAVVCAYRLGVRYLWIDCLCIIQDSKEDWLQQSAIMAEIYSKAFVNFAATASSSAAGGLFRSRSPSDVNPCIVDPHYEDSPGFLYQCVDTGGWRDVALGVLSTRAWAFQEMLLAPRTLHFAEPQIYWQCESLQASEVYVDGLLDAKPDNGKKQLASTRKSWSTIVEAYTFRSLTYESEDKLVALSGIARRVAMNDDVQDDGYLAGIWRSDLPNALLWKSVSGGFPLRNGVPSWSWASISGRVDYSYHVSSIDCPGSVSVVAIDVTRKADPYGQVLGGSIRLSTRYLLRGNLSTKERLEYMHSGFACDFECSDIPYHGLHQARVWPDAQSVYDSNSATNLINIYYCMWIFKMTAYTRKDHKGLLLERVGPGKFRRVGFFKLIRNPTPRESMQMQRCAEAQRLGPDEYEDLDAEGRYMFSVF